MFLIINTINNDKFLIALSKGDELIKKTIPAKYKQTERLLPAVHESLNKNKIHLKNLKGIIVAKGPGSFTALRVGVVTANTLGFALRVPVNGMKAEEFEDLEGLVKKGNRRIKRAKTGKIVKPFYSK